MNTRIHPTENKATTCISIFFWNSGRRNEFSCVGLGLGISLCIFWDSERRKSPYLRGKSPSFSSVVVD